MTLTIESFLTSLPAKKMHQPLAALAVSDIRQFRDNLLSEGRAAATANVAVKILRGPLNLARRQGLLPNNPAEAVDMVTSNATEKGVFTPADVAKLIASAEEDWKGLILARFYTGARLGDLINLKQKDYDSERRSLPGNSPAPHRPRLKSRQRPLHPYRFGNPSQSGGGCSHPKIES